MTNLFTPFKQPIFKLLQNLIWIILFILCLPVIIVLFICIIFNEYFINEKPLVSILKELFIDGDGQFSL